MYRIIKLINDFQNFYLKILRKFSRDTFTDWPFIDDNLPEDDGVLHQWEEHEEHAGEEPDLQGGDGVGDRDPRGGGVEHVYQDKTQCDQQDNSGRHHILQIHYQTRHFSSDIKKSLSVRNWVLKILTGGMKKETQLMVTNMAEGR